MKILFLGDVFGKPGRRIVADSLPLIKQKEEIELVIANGENAAGGSGLTKRVANNLFDSGVDVITGGNHLFQKKEAKEIILEETRIVPPANGKEKFPSAEYRLITTASGKTVGVINLLGRVFMEDLDCPFQRGLELVKKLKEHTPLIIIDFHAEATSEKRAFAHYLSGQVSAIIGTHTHVQTADEQLLNGTAYLTDVGMTGPHHSVIGLVKEDIIQRFLTGKKGKFRVANSGLQLNGVIIELDPVSGRARAIRRVNSRIEEKKD